MRTIRPPQNHEEISPQLIGDLIANLRKVSNISGTGCTIHELPGGISIDVPTPPEPEGFWAILGDPKGINGGYNQQSNDPRCYQWQEAQWKTGDTSHNETAKSGTYCKPVPGGDTSSVQISAADGTTKLIVDRAREVNDAITVPAGTVVWLEPAADYTVNVYNSGSSGASGDAPGTEYTFHYNPATIQGTLTQNLLPTDSNALVNVKLSDGTQAGAGPYNALNLYCESGNGGTGLGGDICLLLPNDQIGTNLQSPTPNYPYILLRVIPKSQTSYQPGYDGSGNWTAIPQGFYAAGQTAAGSATPYATGAQAGSDLERDGTTTALSLSSSSITYGTLLTLTATVSHTSGTGDPSGTVVFSDGVTNIPVAGTFTSVGGGVFTLSNVIMPAGSYTNITATYGGDGNYNPSTSSAQSLTVNKANVTVSMSAAAPTGTSNPNYYGSDLTLTANISSSVGSGVPGPTGIVLFQNNTSGTPGAPVTVSLPVRIDTTYQGQYTLDNLPAGTLTLQAAYQGDQNFNSANGTCTQTVKPAPLAVTADPQQMAKGGQVPVLTASYALFLLNDTFYSACTGQPALNTSATSGSDVGTYPITCAVGTLAAPNYKLSFNDGKLTVVAASS